MPFLARLSLLLVLLTPRLSPVQAKPVAFPTDLSKWIATPPPRPETQRWSAANQSESEWKVSLQQGKVAVMAYDRQKAYASRTPLPFSPRQKTVGEMIVTKVNDGWIVGFNGGEWGGSLWWYSPRGDKNYLISKEQVIGFIRTRTGLLALEGLAHLGLDRGQILQFYKNTKGQWKTKRLVDLQQEPQVALREKNGSLLVATTKRLLRVHLNKRVEVLLDNAFWWGLYPNSIVVTPSKEIYVGMRHGVARLQPSISKGRVQWLLPNRASVNAKPKY